MLYVGNENIKQNLILCGNINKWSIFVQSLNVRFFTFHEYLIDIRLKEIYPRINGKANVNKPLIRRIIEAHTELIQWGMDKQKMISEQATNKGYFFLGISAILLRILGL